jgi:hypothetical protein
MRENMVWDDIAEAEETVGILIDAELEIHHWLQGHQQPLRQCPVCRTLTGPGEAGAAD